jgi:hypothetical protein
MDKIEVFAAVRNSIVNEPSKSYKTIAAECGISVSTVQLVAGILLKTNGFRRPLGRPLGSGKRNGRQGPQTKGRINR